MKLFYFFYTNTADLKIFLKAKVCKSSGRFLSGSPVFFPRPQNHSFLHHSPANAFHPSTSILYISIWWLEFLISCNCLIGLFKHSVLFKFLFSVPFRESTAQSLIAFRLFRKRLFQIHDGYVSILCY